MQLNQAANELTEEQVLNFLANTLDEEIDIELGENADIDSEAIWDVLIGVAPMRTRSAICARFSRNHPTATRFSIISARSSNSESSNESARHSIQQDILELLPDQPVEVVCNLHLRPYYGDEYDSEKELYESLAKAGTMTFHGYATLCARMRNKRYTLAVRRLTDGDTASPILAELLGILEGLDPEVKAVYLDREFYDTYCLTLLAAHNLRLRDADREEGEAIQDN